MLLPFMQTSILVSSHTKTSLDRSTARRVNTWRVRREGTLADDTRGVRRAPPPPARAPSARARAAGAGSPRGARGAGSRARAPATAGAAAARAPPPAAPAARRRAGPAGPGAAAAGTGPAPAPPPAAPAPPPAGPGAGVGAPWGQLRAPTSPRPPVGPPPPRGGGGAGGVVVTWSWVQIVVGLPLVGCRVVRAARAPVVRAQLARVLEDTARIGPVSHPEAEVAAYRSVDASLASVDRVLSALHSLFSCEFAGDIGSVFKVVGCSIGGGDDPRGLVGVGLILCNESNRGALGESTLLDEEIVAVKISGLTVSTLAKSPASLESLSSSEFSSSVTELISPASLGLGEGLEPLVSGTVGVASGVCSLGVPARELRVLRTRLRDAWRRLLCGLLLLAPGVFFHK
ncbi:hypothetical protein SFRURICE_012217 [Spodoptera frugiperda]|nr:hypothetical protein SFRURICE_012217 [Spodoptera frugiperda]